MIFEKYQKPIILINSCRYDLPLCWSKNAEMLTAYKACLQRLHAKGLLIAVSNNKADQLYTRVGCGIYTTHIPSFCGYTNLQYAPTQPTFLCYSGQFPAHPLITPKSAIGRFQWSTLATFKGIIHVPYEISTMSMFEHYTAGIPLFFPSRAYMDAHGSLQSVSAYWAGNLPAELSAFANKSVWLSLADFYQVFAASPNVYFYDSFPHLIKILEGFVWKEDGDVRKAHEKNIRDTWKSVLTPLLASS